MKCPTAALWVLRREPLQLLITTRLLSAFFCDKDSAQLLLLRWSGVVKISLQGHWKADRMVLRGSMGRQEQRAWLRSMCMISLPPTTCHLLSILKLLSFHDPSGMLLTISACYNSIILFIVAMQLKCSLPWSRLFNKRLDGFSIIDIHFCSFQRMGSC